MSSSKESLLPQTEPEADVKTGETGCEDEAKWPIPVLKENLHYYMENGLMVFTEAYHSARGRCCGNACRHCPFEHANVRR